ncbi:hypothetical protein Pelo_17108 [Pelomyxa schiedti]|nr:hypothetical protein Pelo_17108 [Pelomyxa schiedti]
MQQRNNNDETTTTVAEAVSASKLQEFTPTTTAVLRTRDQLLALAAASHPRCGPRSALTLGPQREGGSPGGVCDAASAGQVARLVAEWCEGDGDGDGDGGSRWFSVAARRYLIGGRTGGGAVVAFRVSRALLSVAEARAWLPTDPKEKLVALLPRRRMLMTDRCSAYITRSLATGLDTAASHCRTWWKHAVGSSLLGPDPEPRSAYIPGLDNGEGTDPELAPYRCAAIAFVKSDPDQSAVLLERLAHVVHVDDEDTYVLLIEFNAAKVYSTKAFGVGDFHRKDCTLSRHYTISHTKLMILKSDQGEHVYIALVGQSPFGFRGSSGVFRLINDHSEVGRFIQVANNVLDASQLSDRLFILYREESTCEIWDCNAERPLRFIRDQNTTGWADSGFIFKPTVTANIKEKSVTTNVEVMDASSGVILISFTFSGPLQGAYSF